MSKMNMGLTETVVNETFSNFQAITEEQDSAICRTFLAENNWNLTAACTVYLELGRNYYEAHPELIKAYEPAPQPIFHPRYGQAAIVTMQTLVLKFLKLLKKPRGCFMNVVEREHAPTFLNTQLEDLLKLSRAKSRPLLVFFIDNSVSDPYLDEIVCSEVTSAYSKEFFYVWGHNASVQPIPSCFAHLQIQGFPFAGIFHYVRGQLKLLGRLEGNFTEDEFTLMIDKCFIKTQGNEGVVKKFEEERRMRQQQELEYLAAEQEMREKHQREHEAALAEECAAAAARAVLQSKIEAVGPEPSEGPETSQLVFRLPGGARHDRRFDKGTALRVLYDYIETLELGIPFELVFSFPAQVLEPSEDSLEAAGLHPKSTLHVREIVN